MTGTVIVSITTGGLPVGETVNLTVVLAAPVGQVQTPTLAIGANTIVVPPGNPRYVLIQPPPNNTNLITLKGVAGDTGIPLDLTGPTLVSLAPALASFVLNAAAQITGMFIAFY